MEKLYLLLLLTAALGCEKQKEQVQENLIITAMTNGQWKVTSLTVNGVDKTSDFTTYKFKFNTNQTVDAINNSSLEKTGTWDASMQTQTITSNFTSVNQPLSWLNGTWNISSTTWTSVNASLVIGAENRTLRLDKL